ncbi:MAG TPA: hypothetical protein VH189_11970 [Rhizomicrobium sp.]|jgi:hypothetical protein|nr:hypothetical protein [Rhizomicrobium sp.]
MMTGLRTQTFAAHLFAAWAMLFALPQAAHAVGLIHISDRSLCVDGMETDPDGDDEDTILVAADEGCMIQPLDIISI